jgi:hypothetical protein
LETVNVDAWLTLMSQDHFCLSPVVEAEATDTVKSPHVDVRLSTNALSTSQTEVPPPAIVAKVSNFSSNQQSGSV